MAKIDDFDGMGNADWFLQLRESEKFKGLVEEGTHDVVDSTTLPYPGLHDANQYHEEKTVSDDKFFAALGKYKDSATRERIYKRSVFFGYGQEGSGDGFDVSAADQKKYATAWRQADLWFIVGNSTVDQQLGHYDGSDPTKLDGSIFFQHRYALNAAGQLSCRIDPASDIYVSITAANLGVSQTVYDQLTAYQTAIQAISARLKAPSIVTMSDNLTLSPFNQDGTPVLENNLRAQAQTQASGTSVDFNLAGLVSTMQSVATGNTANDTDALFALAIHGVLAGCNNIDFAAMTVTFPKDKVEEFIARITGQNTSATQRTETGISPFAVGSVGFEHSRALFVHDAGAKLTLEKKEVISNRHTFWKMDAELSSSIIDSNVSITHSDGHIPFDHRAFVKKGMVLKNTLSGELEIAKSAELPGSVAPGSTGEASLLGMTSWLKNEDQYLGNGLVVPKGYEIPSDKEYMAFQSGNKQLMVSEVTPNFNGTSQAGINSRPVIFSDDTQHFEMGTDAAGNDILMINIWETDQQVDMRFIKGDIGFADEYLPLPMALDDDGDGYYSHSQIINVAKVFPEFVSNRMEIRTAYDSADPKILPFKDFTLLPDGTSERRYNNVYRLDPAAVRDFVARAQSFSEQAGPSPDFSTGNITLTDPLTGESVTYNQQQYEDEMTTANILDLMIKGELEQADVLISQIHQDWFDRMINHPLLYVLMFSGVLTIVTETGRDILTLTPGIGRLMTFLKAKNAARINARVATDPETLAAETDRRVTDARGRSQAGTELARGEALADADQSRVEKAGRGAGRLRAHEYVGEGAAYRTMPDELVATGARGHGRIQAAVQTDPENLDAARQVFQPREVSAELKHKLELTLTEPPEELARTGMALTEAEKATLMTIIDSKMDKDIPLTEAENKLFVERKCASLMEARQRELASGQARVVDENVPRLFDLLWEQSKKSQGEPLSIMIESELGGTGKTWLAVKAAMDTLILGTFEDGVPLESRYTPEQIAFFKSQMVILNGDFSNLFTSAYVNSAQKIVNQLCIYVTNQRARGKLVWFFVDELGRALSSRISGGDTPASDILMAPLGDGRLPFIGTMTRASTRNALTAIGELIRRFEILFLGDRNEAAVMKGLKESIQQSVKSGKVKPAELGNVAEISAYLSDTTGRVPVPARLLSFFKEIRKTAYTLYGSSIADPSRSKKVLSEYVQSENGWAHALRTGKDPLAPSSFVEFMNFQPLEESGKLVEDIRKLDKKISEKFSRTMAREELALRASHPDFVFEDNFEKVLKLEPYGPRDALQHNYDLRKAKACLEILIREMESLPGSDPEAISRFTRKYMLFKQHGLDAFRAVVGTKAVKKSGMAGMFGGTEDITDTQYVFDYDTDTMVKVAVDKLQVNRALKRFFDRHKIPESEHQAYRDRLRAVMADIETLPEHVSPEARAMRQALAEELNGDWRHLENPAEAFDGIVEDATKALKKTRDLAARRPVDALTPPEPTRAAPPPPPPVVDPVPPPPRLIPVEPTRAAPPPPPPVVDPVPPPPPPPPVLPAPVDPVPALILEPEAKLLWESGRGGDKPAAFKAVLKAVHMPEPLLDQAKVWLNEQVKVGKNFATSWAALQALRNESTLTGDLKIFVSDLDRLMKAKTKGLVADAEFKTVMAQTPAERAASIVAIEARPNPKASQYQGNDEVPSTGKKRKLFDNLHPEADAGDNRPAWESRLDQSIAQWQDDQLRASIEADALALHQEGEAASAVPKPQSAQPPAPPVANDALPAPVNPDPTALVMDDDGKIIGETRTGVPEETRTVLVIGDADGDGRIIGETRGGIPDDGALLEMGDDGIRAIDGATVPKPRVTRPVTKFVGEHGSNLAAGIIGGVAADAGLRGLEHLTGTEFGEPVHFGVALTGGTEASHLAAKGWMRYALGDAAGAAKITRVMTYGSAIAGLPYFMAGDYLAKEAAIGAGLIDRDNLYSSTAVGMAGGIVASSGAMWALARMGLKVAKVTPWTYAAMALFHSSEVGKDSDGAQYFFDQDVLAANLILSKYNNENGLEGSASALGYEKLVTIMANWGVPYQESMSKRSQPLHETIMLVAHSLQEIDQLRANAKIASDYLSCSLNESVAKAKMKADYNSVNNAGTEHKNLNDADIELAFAAVKDFNKAVAQLFSAKNNEGESLRDQIAGTIGQFPDAVSRSTARVLLSTIVGPVVLGNADQGMLTLNEDDPRDEQFYETALAGAFSGYLHDNEDDYTYYAGLLQQAAELPSAEVDPDGNGEIDDVEQMMYDEANAPLSNSSSQSTSVPDLEYGESVPDEENEELIDEEQQLYDELYEDLYREDES
jgi:hypothetical protein